MLPNSVVPDAPQNDKRLLQSLLCPGQGVVEVDSSDADVKGRPQSLLSGFKLEV